MLNAKKHLIIILLYFAIAWLCPQLSYSKEAKKDIWQIHEILTNRLSAEWFKLGVLENDLKSIRDILMDIRDFQLFPYKITQLNEDKIIAFDKEIEKAEKKHKKILAELNTIRMPLSDAIAILREMVIKKPVRDMFKVIEAGDMERITYLIALKHDMDILWDETESIMDSLSFEMKCPVYKSDDLYGLEKEFFEIIKANLGKKSEKYYEKLNHMKESLVNRIPKSEINKMYKIEIYQLKKMIRPGNEEITKRKIMLMQKRYKNKITLYELDILLARVQFQLGDFHDVIKTMANSDNQYSFVNEKTMYIIQSWYSLEKYDTICNWAKSFDFSVLTGNNKNLAIWIVIESGLAQDTVCDFSKFSELMDIKSSYRLHIMHSLARSYIKNEQSEIALSVLKKSLNTKQENAIDIIAYDRIMLTYAQLLYETTDYRTSLEYFFKLLQKDGYFEEGLFGIATCYISLGMYKKAEMTLKKLINQSPQSSRSAEAILVMAKRFTNKAEYEWHKLTYLFKEKKRLKRIYEKISIRIQAEKTKDNIEKYTKAKKEISGFLEKIKSEKISNYNDINALYGRAIDFCGLVNQHYETGSFQEISFTEEREKILHQLDSLILIGKSVKHNIFDKNTSIYHKKESIKAIKNIVDESYVISATILLSKFKWVQEYFDWQKLNLNELRNDVNMQYTDSTDSIQNYILKKQEKNISHKIDSLINVENMIQNEWSEKLTTMLSRLLETKLDTSNEIHFAYHLGELYYKKENDKYFHNFEIYEENMQEFDSLSTLFKTGTINQKPEEPDVPLLNHSESVEYYKGLIRKYPYHPFVFAPIYGLAWCYNDMGLFDSAMKQMEVIAKKFPMSPYAPQAWLYIGEYYFDKSKLENAMLAYRSVMKYPESEWFDDALYKLAWTQYRLSNPEKAISSFLALVDLGKGKKTGKALLESESLDYIAISFSESDPSGEKGLKRAKAFCKKLGEPKKGQQILHRLARVYEEQGRYAMAKKTYLTLLRMYPQYEKSPLVENSLIKVTTRDLPLEEANKYKMEFFEKYNKKGDWAAKQEDSSSINFADSVAEAQLYDVSLTYHQLALQKNNSLNYSRAMSTYEKFIINYPKSKRTNECHYNFAEILFSTGDYYRAAVEYIEVTKRYPNSKYKETAAWNAIVASQNLLKEEIKKK